MDCFTFTGAAGDRVRLHVLDGPVDRHAEIVRQNGTTLCSGLDSTFSGTELTCRLDTSGTTRIIFDSASGLLTGGYTIAIQRLNTGAGCTPVAFGAPPATGTLSAAGELDCFTFSAVSGDRILLRSAATSPLFVQTELFQPNGTLATCSGCPVDGTGTFTVLVRSGGAFDTGDYSLSVQRLNNPVGCTPIAYGGVPATGSIASLAETDCFTFTGAAGDRVHIDFAQTTGSLGVGPALFDPTGRSTCGSLASDCRLATSGTQAILVGIFLNTNGGDYALSIQRTNNPVGCTALGFGAPATLGTISAAAEDDCFTFTGNRGDSIEIRSVVTSGQLALNRLVARADGNFISCSNPGANRLVCVLTTTGTHTLMLRDLSPPGSTHTGDYALEIQRLNNPVGCVTIPFSGSPIAGSIGTAAEFDCYRLTGNAGQTLVLELDETSGSLVGEMRLVRPNGNEICGPTTEHSAELQAGYVRHVHRPGRRLHPDADRQLQHRAPALTGAKSH